MLYKLFRRLDELKVVYGNIFNYINNILYIKYIKMKK